jgi:hypothetical protein
VATNFHFDTKGVGDLLRAGRLVVPPNQRPYAWKDTHVRTFLEDLNEAITNSVEDYFLGTVVLVQEGKELPSIADGQQRIATTSIVLARIRDLLHEIGRTPSARSIDHDFLRSIDRDTEATVARLSLNLEDNEFFRDTILPSPMDDDYVPSKLEPTRASNQRIKAASELAANFLRVLIEPLPAPGKASHLLRWVSFIQEHVSVITVTVPDEVGAYRMFETLNDRGLKASQADILKNYLYSRAGPRLTEMITAWSNIGASVEILGGDENERLITYIRHYWVTKNGPTKERELAAAIRGSVTSQTRALQFATEAAGAVQDYVALWSADHPKWSSYPSSVQRNVETLAVHLQVEQIRPLLFAVAREFTPEEAEKAFRLFVSWSVRFLIFGGRGGMLDTQYSLRAADVGTKKIAKATELRDAMKKYVPTDAEFEQAFRTARVSRSHLARYYLRALEKSRQADPQPEYIANEEAAEINLEHILPLTPTQDWGVGSDDARAVQKRLGNMVLLRAGTNTDIGNKPFSEKKVAYAASGYMTTSEVATRSSWGLTEIEERQAELARLAVKTWPLTFGS